MSEEKEVKGEVIETSDLNETKASTERPTDTNTETNASSDASSNQTAAKDSSEGTSSNAHNSGNTHAESNTAQQEAPQQSFEPATPSSEERNWAMFCHLAGLSSIVGIPLLNVIAPLVLWLLKREESEYINQQGREALNFQITITLAAIVSLILIVVFIGMLTLPVVMLFWFVMTIIGGVKASSGENFEYPLTLRLIS